MKPGIYPGIANAEYHAGPGLSRSRLKLLLEGTPLDFHAALPVEESDAMKLGTAAHLAILEPEAFAARVVSMPDFGDMRTKVAKEAKAEWEAAQKPGAIAVPADDYDIAREAAEIVRHKKGPRTALRSGQAELSMYWEQDGVLCKTRPDFCDQGRGLICDVKTTKGDLGDRTVVRSLVDHYAAMQAAMANCASVALLGRPAAVYLLFVRLARPVDMRLVHIAPEWLEYGEAQFLKALAIYRECQASDAWPGWAERDVTTVAMPKWVSLQADELLRETIAAAN